MSVQSIGIKIWGDLKDLTTALSKGKADVSDFAKGTEGAFRNLSSTVRQHEATIKDLSVTYGSSSKEVKRAVAELRPLQERLKEAGTAAKGTRGMFSDFKSEVSSLALGFVGVGAAVGGAVAMFKGAIEGALAEEAANKKLKFALNDSAQATERMLRFKENMMSTTLFTEDEIMNATNMGLELGRTENQVKNMVTAAMGLANVTGVDLNTAMLQLSGTYEGNIGKLGKLAGELKGLTKDQLANGDAVDIINAKYGKFSREGLDTMSGEVQQMKKYWGEALEDVGVGIMNMFQAIGNGWKQYNSLMATGKFRDEKKEKSYQDTADKKQQIQATLDSIAAMRDQAKADQTRNFYLEQLNAKTEKNIKVLSAQEIAAAKAKKELEDYNRVIAEGALTITQGEMGAESINTMKGFGITGAPSLTGKGAGVQQGSEQGTLPKQILDIVPAIEQAKSAVAGLNSVFSGVFASLANGFVKFKEGFTGGWKEIASTIGDVMSSAVSMVSGLLNQQSNERLSQLDQQSQAQRENIENSKMSETNKKKALDKLDKDTAKQKKQLLREQAKDNKEAAIVQAIIAGALGVIQATAAPFPLNVIMPILVGALAAVQVAAIVSQPLPALAMGGLAYAPTMAMVGDNPGAMHDPEVIAPLSKLKQYMSAGDNGGELSVVLRGDDLKFVLDRSNRNANRKY